MKVKNIYVKNFRNYKEEKIEFSDNVNIIYGENGQGKTNIIEAIYYFCQGKSYRGAKDREVVKFDEESAYIKMEFEALNRKFSSDIEIKENKVIRVNELSIKRLSELMSYVKAVIFTPEHLNIIKSGPSMRRNFIDSFLSSLYPVYFNNLVNYYKTIKQKNAILKSRNRINDAILSVWNEKLAVTGVIISKYREEMIKKLNPYIKKYQKEISDEKEDIYIYYNKNIKEYKDKESLYNYLEENKEREKEAGISIIGPHRDDLVFMINNKNAKLFSSQGQQRTAILSLKLSEADIIKEIINEYPIMLLDDITSELDEKRIRYLTEKIKDKQVIITCTKKEENIEKNLNTRIFRIKEGKVMREE